jgi:hypothetical protein
MLKWQLLNLYSLLKNKLSWFVFLCQKLKYKNTNKNNKKIAKNRVEIKKTAKKLFFKLQFQLVFDIDSAKKTYYNNYICQRINFITTKIGTKKKT